MGETVVDSLLMRALMGDNPGRPPVWLMRQAGRYMAPYQELKKSHPHLSLFFEPELICKITKLPIDLLDVDAAILFSDILMVLQGLGRKWHFEEGAGPIVEKVVDPSECLRKEGVYSHVHNSIIALKKELLVPLIGFAGGPLTIASYLIEGKPSIDLKGVKRWIYTKPDAFLKLLTHIEQATIDYLHVQIEAGVDALQLFDTWAGLLSLPLFQEWAAPSLKRVLTALKSKVPVIYFCKNTFRFVEVLETLSFNALSFDDSMPLHPESSSLSIQGNLDPHLLFAPKKKIEEEATALLRRMRGSSRYIFNLGHGIMPETPFDHVLHLVETIKNAASTP